MKLHHQIMHHVRKHKERVIAHVEKHHKKYLVGAGMLSGIAVYKTILLMMVFFGITNTGGITGADYYDNEYYAEQKEIRINSINGDGRLSGEDHNPSIIK